jgi:hypothetical protein
MCGNSPTATRWLPNQEDISHTYCHGSRRSPRCSCFRARSSRRNSSHQRRSSVRTGMGPSSRTHPGNNTRPDKSRRLLPEFHRHLTQARSEYCSNSRPMGPHPHNPFGRTLCSCRVERRCTMDHFRHRRCRKPQAGIHTAGHHTRHHRISTSPRKRMHSPPGQRRARAGAPARTGMGATQIAVS